MLNKLTIKFQLTLISIAITASSAGMLGLLWFSIERVNQLDLTSIHVNEVQISMLSLRRHEKDFLLRNDLKYQQKFNNEYQQLQTLLATLNTEIKSMGLSEEHVRQLSGVFNSYAEKFNQLVSVQKIIGLHEKDGLYGSLRNAVHNAETRLEELQDYQLTAHMLTLRRREKDFMLREDEKYVEKFQKDFDSMMHWLERSAHSSNVRADISKLLTLYRDDFIGLINGYQQKGMSPELGIRGELRNAVHKTEELMQLMHEEVKQGVHDNIEFFKVLTVILVSVLAALVVLGILMINRRIIRSISQLSTVMATACKSHDLGLRSITTGKDEIATMSGVFNEMMDEFESVIKQVKQNSEQLSQSAGQLSVISQQTLAGVTRQHTESDMVATAMNEMSATVSEVARSASDAAHASQTADDEAKNSKKVVRENTDGIRQLASEVDRISQIISELSTESENIGTVLNVIREIAEQTNLLALNAAIEAARAGEQGRGFAVVADEVRTLASRSQRSTQEIQEIVERLQTRAAASMQAMETGRKNAQEGVQRADSVSNSLEVIMREISSINQKNMQIAAAAEEQASVAEEINRNINKISQIANQTSDGAEHSTHTAQQLNVMAQQLYTMVEVFKVRQ